MSHLSQLDYWVYVLQNPLGKFYVGLTSNLVIRLQQHNSGVSKWTKKHGPWVLVWQQGPMNLSSARKLESRLKKQKGGNGFFEITGLPPHSGS